jgi:hypothetical protein
MDKAEMLEALRPHLAYGDWEELQDEGLYEISDLLIEKWVELTGQENYKVSNHTDEDEDMAFFSASSWSAEYGITLIGKAEPTEKEKARLAAFIKFACPGEEPEWALEHYSDR